MNILARGMKQAIEWMYGFSGDYGVAIVLITVVVRVLLLPFNAQQRKQMKKQQEMSAEVEMIKEKYKNNQQKMNEELQKLYEEKGIGGGCLISFVQFPIMLCLYHAIRLTVAAGTATVLLPWVSSLLARDSTLVLPVATLIVQLLPQTYPYIRYFKALNLQKMSMPMILTLLLTNSMFAFVIPSGVGLYYFVSGLFSAIEQLAFYIRASRKGAYTA